MFARMFALVSLVAWAATMPAAEVVTITPANAAAVAPAGKEADWIHGDHVLRNDRLVAVVARPVASRHANMTIRNVGGCIIDITSRQRPNDQLGCYYPAAGLAEFRTASAAADGGEPTSGEDLAIRGDRVRLQVTSPPAAARPGIVVVYELADGDDCLSVTTTWSNPGTSALPIKIADRVRADRTFTSAIAPDDGVAWWDDEWFGQTFAIVPQQAGFKANGAAVVKIPGRDPIEFVPSGGPVAELPPGGSLTLSRRVFAADGLLAARSIAHRLGGRPNVPVTVAVRDPAGGVGGAIVAVLDAAGQRYAAGRSDPDGRLAFTLPRGDATWKLVADARASGRGTAELALTADAPRAVEVDLPRPGIVVATITDQAGRPVPCKVRFRGRGLPDPDFAPDSDDTAVRNLVYSHDGRFRRELAPGTYDVVISRGPEYDAVPTTITVSAGVETPLAATLTRVVDTRGWISTDFHSHSSPSGDNTSSQLGRVQNLLAEHVEFAPCTEHNRISSYVPHLERLGAGGFMATCSGMELSGAMLDVNHQNAFPLAERRGTQDGGGPTVVDDDPVAQVERLALWDDGAEKVVQMNHPNLMQVLGDRDTDRRPDGGFERMLGFVDVIEVHPLEDVLTPPAADADPRKRSHAAFRWLQMLNLGYRLPGVVNTDAHYNFDGSGFLRNYVASPTDDPAAIRTADVVRASEAGRIVMTSGPFLEVSGRAGDAGTAAGPGETLRAADGRLSLAIRVQCPNWFDVDRVQVFVNGRPDPKFAYTRRSHGDLFTRNVVRFDQTLPVSLAGDAHLVVVALGEESNLGLVMGPDHARLRPIAVSNPIYVDVDGGGFKANGDLLDRPFHHQPQPTSHHHPHDHPHDHAPAARPTPSPSPSPAAVATRRPNLLVIVADDLGYADVGFHGCRDIPTPHLDALAAGGVLCTNGYVSGPYCSPTRAGLMTGRYQQRFGHEFNSGGPGGGLPVDQTTLADRLSKAGYATALVGKWHLGEKPECHPLARGFGEFFGFLGGGHSYRPGGGRILRDRAAVAEPEYLTDAFGREAARFVERDHGRPFFLYLAFNAVHTPMEADAGRLARVEGLTAPARRTYAAMLIAMDDAVGRVMQAIRGRGLERDTLVFFFSDNGGPTMPGTTQNASRNDPLRGSKRQTLEGGIRVPFVVSWPGTLAPRRFDLPVIQLDVAPTALAAAGLPVEPGDFDGVDILPHLAGRDPAPPHASLTWRFGRQMAIRQGDWKLVRFGPDESLAEGESWPHLYNLSADPGESRNLAAAEPQRVAALEAAWQAWDATLPRPSGKSGGQHAGKPRRAGDGRPPR